MKKNIIIFIIGCIINLNLNAQWQSLNGPYGGRVNCLSFKNNKAFAGTTFGFYYLSDSTNYWLESNDGFAQNPSDTMSYYSINCIDVNNSRIIVGITPGIYASFDEGLHWQSIKNNLPQGTSVYTVASDSSKIFIGTFMNCIYSSTNNGASWNYSSSGLPSGSTIKKIFINGNNIYTSISGGHYKSTNNGISWQLMASAPIYQAYSYLTLNSTLIIGTTNGIYSSQDDGASWVHLTNGIPNTLISSLAKLDTVVYAGSNNGIYRSIDKGISWSYISSKPVYDLQVKGNNIYVCSNEGVSYFNNSDFNFIDINSGLDNFYIGTYKIDSIIFAATNNSLLFSSTNDGISWERKNYLNPKINCIIKYNNKIFAGTVGIFSSTNYGNSWQNSSNGISSSNEIFDMKIFNNNLYAATFDGLYVSNNGLDWQYIDIGNPPNTNAFSITICQNKIFVLSYDGVYESSNGLNWVSVNSGLTVMPYTKLSSNDEYVFSAGYENVYRLFYNDTTWYPFQNNFPSNTYIYPIYSDSINNFVSVSNYGLYHSTNNGQSWVSINDGFSRISPITTICKDYNYFYCGLRSVWKMPICKINPYLISNDISICQGESYFAGGNFQTESGIYYDTLQTINGCDSIITSNLTVNILPQSPTISQIGDTLFSSITLGNQWYNANGVIIGESSNYFIPTESGTYYVIVTENGCNSDTSNIIMVIIDNLENYNRKSELILSPNPVKNNLTIEIVNSKSYQSLEILNIFGQSVYNTNFFNRYNIDMTNFSDGLYFIKIISNNSISLKRIIKQ